MSDEGYRIMMLLSFHINIKTQKRKYCSDFSRENYSKNALIWIPRALT